tara:strand:+ start:261 stop:551 length:291 start_codon:yes stop_codon:yes gene_type:complete
MMKLKSLLTEKKELGGVMIDKISNLTDRNAHNMARETLAKAMGSRVLVKNYQALSTLHTLFRDMNDLKDARARLDKMLFAQAEKMYSDYKDIYNAY